MIEQLSLIAFLKTSCISQTFLHLMFISLLLILHDLLKNFLLLKIYEKKKLVKDLSKRKNEKKLCTFYAPYHGVPFP